MGQQVRIVIIEGLRFMRDLLGSVVCSIPDFKLVLQTSSLEDCISRLPDENPHVVLLDIDSEGAQPENKIAQILQLNPDVGVICTTQRWDETTARIVVAAGAKGYLTKPLTAEILIEAVKSFKGSKLLPVSETITFLSPKGNCGKTTLAVNLAVGLAQETEHRVGLIDADLFFGDIPVYLNVEPQNTIVEAVRDLKHISPSTLGAYLSTYKTNNNRIIKILPGARRPELAELINIESTLKILSIMRSLFRYVVIDTVPGFDKRSLALAKASDHVYVVVAFNSRFDLEHLKRYLDALLMLGYSENKIKIIMSRLKTRGEIQPLSHRLQEQFPYPIAALLPNQFQLATNALNKGIPLVEANRSSSLTQVILDIVKNVAQGTGRR